MPTRFSFVITNQHNDRLYCYVLRFLEQMADSKSKLYS
jgi:hypothetical protein